MRILILCTAATVSLAFGCAPLEEASQSTASAITVRPDVSASSSAGEVPHEVLDALRDPDRLSDAALDRLYRLEHDVTVAPGRVIHATETFTLRSWLRWPHRAMLLVPGPVTNAAYYNIDVPGYDAGEMLAHRGFFAFAADLEGAGRSSMPADGRIATLPRQVENMTSVLHFIATRRFVPRIDILGESWGGGIAAELCADSFARTCVMSSMIYRNASDIGNATFRSPEFHALLDTFTDGYIPTFPGFYFQFVAASTPEVQAFTFATQPGRYSVAPEYAVFELPFFDPTHARAPGIILRGENDPNQPLSDTQELARDYGRHGAELVVLAGGNHVPRVDAPPVNTQFWDTVFGFVDSAPDHDR